MYLTALLNHNAGFILLHQKILVCLKNQEERGAPTIFQMASQIINELK